MVQWRVTAGMFCVVIGAFAVWCARIASNLYLLSAQIRQSIGREVPEDDPTGMAMVYLAAAMVMAAVAGSLCCYAVVARPARSRG